MKLVIAVFAVCLVAIEAGFISKTSISNKDKREEVLKAMALVNKNMNTVTKQIDQNIFRSKKNVTIELDYFEMLRQQDSTCVAKQDEEIQAAATAFRKAIHVCNCTAAIMQKEIAADIRPAVQHILFQGKDLLRSYQDCDKIPNVAPTTFCLRNLPKLVDLYLSNARQVSKKTKTRTHAGINEIGSCTYRATEKFVNKSHNIHRIILDCMDNKDCVI